jgi:hypothetical protein
MTCPTCGSCRFWSYSMCRRYPPLTNRQGGFAVDRPMTKRSDWCGEYQPDGTGRQPTEDKADD